jgi:hypothetical protein
MRVMPLPGRMSRSARKGGVILLAAFSLLIIAALLPYLWLAGVRSQITQQKAAYELVAARVGTTEGARAPRLTAEDQPERLFLSGETEGTALAAFQSQVGDAAGRSGMSVLRLQSLPAAGATGLVPVRLSVDCAGSLSQLRSFLAEIEAAVPLVVVTGLEVEPRTSDGEAQPHPSEDLAVSLKLEAYSWRAAP